MNWKNVHSLFMPFKWKFSMHPNSQRALHELASWKQHVCVWFHLAHPLSLSFALCAMCTHTNHYRYMHVSDCIGGCQNMRMHLRKSRCPYCHMHRVFVHLNCRIIMLWVYAWLHMYLYVCIWNWDDRNVMWTIEIDAIYPSSIESSSQFCCSWNACLLSISSVSLSLPQSFFAETTLVSIQRIFYSCCLFWLDSFIHMLLSFFFGGRLLNTVPVTSELKYLTNEWWWCCCCCPFALLLLLLCVGADFYRNKFPFGVCLLAIVLFCLSTGFICSFVSHAHLKYIHSYTFFCVSFTFLPRSRCVSSLWPFRISSVWV